MQDVPLAFFSAACREKYSPLPARGVPRANGGKKISGNRRNGIWRFISILPSETIRARSAIRIAVSTCSITTRRAEAGLREEFTTNVYRTSCSVGLQLSRRRVLARRIGWGLRATPYAGDCIARSRRRVWFASFASGDEEAFHSRPHRRRSYVSSWLALSPARRIARRLSEFVPPNHAHEAARPKRRGQRTAGGNSRAESRFNLLDGRRRRPAGTCSGARRNGRRREVRARTLPDVRPAQYLRRTSAPFLSRRRSPQSGCGHNRQKSEIAFARNQWCLLRAETAARSTGCFYLHPPSPHA